MVGGWLSPPNADLAAVVLGARLLLGVIFASAGAAKLRDRAAFRQAVDRYELLPDALVGPFATSLPAVELAAGAALIMGVATPQSAAVVMLLLFGFAVAVTVNLLRGRDIDCGCSGASGSAKISWWLVARNLALAAVAAGVVAVTAGPYRAALGPVPAGDLVAVGVAVVAALGTVRLLADAAAVRAAARASDDARR